MEYSMGRYKSVWGSIKSAARSIVDDVNLFAFIAAEAVTDLHRLREYSLMDSSQRQFWLEYHVWNILRPCDEFPGDLSLLKEIDRLRLSRQRSACEEQAKLTASVRKIKKDFNRLGENEWQGRDHTYLYKSKSEDEGVAVDLESVQNQFDVAARSRGTNLKPTPNEELLHQLVLQMKRDDFKVDPLCTSEQFEEALEASESIDPDRTKYSVRFVPDQDIIDALYGYKSSHEDVQFVEEQLDVKLSRRVEIIQAAGSGTREFVISARPLNIFEALLEPRKLHEKLRGAFHFLRYWKYLIGGDRIKKRWDSSIQLTTLRRAFIKHKNEKRGENNTQQPQVSKAKKMALKPEKQQRTFSLSTNKNLLGLTPAFLKNSPNNVSVVSDTGHLTQPHTLPKPITQVSRELLLDLEPPNQVPCPSTKKRKRATSLEPSDRVPKCAKFVYSSALNPGFATPELA